MRHGRCWSEPPRCPADPPCCLPCAAVPMGQEMLEDDKLGTFDQLLMAQEEVVALQSQVRNVKGHASGTL